MAQGREVQNQKDIAALKKQVAEIAGLKKQVAGLQKKLEELMAALKAAAKEESDAGAKKGSGAGGPAVDWDAYDKKVMAFEKARREVERCGAKIAKLTEAEAKEYAGKVDAARTAEMELSLLSGRIAHSLLGESDAVRWEVVTSSHRPGGSYPAFCGGGGPGGSNYFGGCGYGPYGPGPGGSYPAFCGGGGPGGSYPAFCGGGGPGGSYPAFCGGGGPGGSYPAFCGGGGPGGSYPAFCGGGGPGGSYPAFCGGGGPGGSYPAFCGGGGPGGSYPAFCGGG